jgi:hypothetical protein
VNPQQYRWLTDENIHPQVTHYLTSQGLDGWDVKQNLKQGTTDIDLLSK